MTRARTALLCLILTLLSTSRALADDVGAEADADTVPNPHGLDFGLRLGWAIPQAEAVRGDDLADTVRGAVPIWLDVGYRLARPLVVGLYAQYAYVFVSGCPSDRCHSSDVRFGVQVRWHFGERRSIDHWVGLGAGYEILAEEVDELEGSLSGFEFLNLQFGEDLALGHGLSLGPFFSVSLGKFLLDSRPAEVRRTSVVSPTPGDEEIQNTSFHVWVVLGARLSFAR